ncbi:MAG: sigma-54-dependent transcriptional regulator [Dissulfurispiraceae bacterium]
METILIVEDKKSMSDMLRKAFEAEQFAVKTAMTVQEGMVLFAAGGIDAVVTDLRLPDGDGMELLRAVKAQSPLTPLVVMTGFGSIETAVRAVKEGAYDFLTKPFDPDHLILIVKRALDEKNRQKENLVMRKEFSQFLSMPKIIGVSEQWRALIERVKKVAPLKTTVLILGESGTGKELIARAMHYWSPRSKGPFIAVNCAAIPKDLIENELFGHDKGAFTGAQEVKLGRLELADTGTIFLDEIGDMDLPLQAKLLRVLQENEFERVGGTKTIRVDLRVVAASNKDLEQEVDRGRFREDLFYRLNVFRIVLTPLRQRKQDIIPLASYFISSFSTEMRKEVPSLSPEAEEILLSAEWKGNVREIKNVMERAVILCEGTVLFPEHFAMEKGLLKETPGEDQPLHKIAATAVRLAEKERIENVLMQTHGNKSRAAEILRVSYKTLLNKIKEYGIV